MTMSFPVLLDLTLLSYLLRGCLGWFVLADMFSPEKSPLKYFMDDLFSGHSLRSTTTPGNEKERERVYDTIFRLPWRCELVNLASFFRAPIA